MKTDFNLRIPGPTPCPEEILEAVSRPMMNYRGPEMKALVARLYSKLVRYLETSHEVALVTASGTGGLEAAVTNVASPGDRILGLASGVFGERFCAIAEAYGGNVRRLAVEWGRAADPDDLRRALREEKGLAAVLLTHNETSTGVEHPIFELARVVRAESDAILIVDAISSLGAMPLSIDELGIDLVVTASQKAWGVPPGMAILFLGSRMEEAMKRAKMPRFYFDLRRYREARESGNFPFTPALSVIYGLDVALDAMLRETAKGVHERHRRVAALGRARVKELGLSLYPEERSASPTVTAVRLPAGVDEPALMELLRVKYRTILARGQGRLQGKIVRIGHLGFVEEPEIGEAVDALGRALGELGLSLPSTAAS